MVKDSKLIEMITLDDATIPNIVNQIRHAEKLGPDFITDDFINSIQGRTDIDTYKNLWLKLRKRVKYAADGDHQKTKSPGALWKSKVGDCKSFTVFVASTLQKMCKPYELILDYYDPNFPNRAHIYVMSEGIVIDPVNPIFNASDPHYKQKRYPGISCAGVTGLSNNNRVRHIVWLVLFAILAE